MEHGNDDFRFIQLGRNEANLTDFLPDDNDDDYNDDDDDVVDDDTKICMS